MPIYGLKKPANMEVFHQDDHLILRFPFIPIEKQIPTFILMVIFDLAAIFSTISFIDDLKSGEENTGCLAIFLILFPLFALYITLYAVWSAITTVQIFTDRQTVQCLKQPISLSDPTIFKVNQIRQVFVKQEFRKTNKSGVMVYHVMFILADGSNKALIQYLMDSDHALYIEQMLEEFLNIQPTLVRGAFQ